MATPTPMMRILLYNEQHQLQVTETPIPEPQQGEFLVRVSCTPVSIYDQMFLRGFYRGDRTLPCVPGYECTGTIVREGGGKTKNVGQRVACLSPNLGCWAEYACIPANYCVRIPADLRDEQCAAPFLNPVTAMLMLGDAKRYGYPGICVTAGYSALGKQLVRLAPKYNIKVISLVRLMRHADSLHALGSPCSLVLGDPDFETQFRAAVHEMNCRLCYDGIGGNLSGRILSMMPDGSTLQVYGCTDEVQTCDINASSLIFHNQHLDGFWLMERLRLMKPKDVNKLLSEAHKHWTGALATDIRMIIPMEKLRDNRENYRDSLEHDSIILAPIRRMDRLPKDVPLEARQMPAPSRLPAEYPAVRPEEKLGEKEREREQQPLGRPAGAAIQQREGQPQPQRQLQPAQQPQTEARYMPTAYAPMEPEVELRGPPAPAQPSKEAPYSRVQTGAGIAT